MKYFEHSQTGYQFVLGESKPGPMANVTFRCPAPKKLVSPGPLIYLGQNTDVNYRYNIHVIFSQLHVLL